MKTPNEHIDEVIAEIRASFVKASLRIEDIKPGEKIPATQLADSMAKEQGKKGHQVYPVLKLLFKGYPGVEVRKGRDGGISRPLPNDKKVVVNDRTDEVAAEMPSTEDTEG